MSRIITLSVPKASPSMNTFNGRHWRHYREQKKLWEKYVWVAKADAGVFGMPMLERAKVRFERYGVKLLDEDNLTGGCKMILDSLKALGLIEDDSPGHVTLTVVQKQTTKDKIRTVIHIEELARAVC